MNYYGKKVTKTMNPGEVFYVGKSDRGEVGEVYERAKEHLKRNEFEKIKNYITPKVVSEGNWNQFETAVNEQYIINKHNGSISQNPNTKLCNKIRAIEEKKYNKYRELEGQNPCR